MTNYILGAVGSATFMLVSLFFLNHYVSVATGCLLDFFTSLCFRYLDDFTVAYLFIASSSVSTFSMLFACLIYVFLYKYLILLSKVFSLSLFTLCIACFYFIILFLISYLGRDIICFYLFYFPFFSYFSNLSFVHV